MKINGKYRGIFFIILSSLSFACMNVCVRLAGDIPTFQKSFFRNAVALIIASAVIIKNHQSFKPQSKKNWPAFLGRAFFGTVGMLCNFYTVDHLLLSDASMLNKMSPFFAVLASYFILKEEIKPTQAITLIGAFLGAMFIIKPSFGNMLLGPSLLGLLGGICAGIAYTMVRKLGIAGEQGPLIVFIFSAFSCVVSLVPSIFNFCPMDLFQLISLLGAGLFAAAGQFTITAAYCAAPAGEISIYDYSQVIFAALLGFVLFGDIPDVLSITGYIIICSMAIINFRYNRKHSI